MNLSRGSCAFLLSLAVLFCLSGAAQGETAGTAIPDVYVAASNSFVVSVPNLTRVAVGNPERVVANVISPTEVIVAGRPFQSAAAAFFFGSGSSVNQNGKLDYGTSHLYLWSGEKRYVYRVIVLETDDTTALPPGVTRMEVEPSRVIMYGLTPNVRATSLQIKALEDALGIRIESRMSGVDMQMLEQQSKRLDDATVQTAVDRKILLEGMTKDEMIKTRGEPVEPPSLEIDRAADGRAVKIEEYVYPDAKVRVVDGLVARITPTRIIDDKLVAEAIARGVVSVGMTKEEMIKAKGQPIVPSELQVNMQRDSAGATRAVKLEKFNYPDMVVELSDGFVTRIVVSPSRVLDQAVIQEAISRGIVAVGMTKEEMIKSKGTSLSPPELWVTVETDTRSGVSRAVKRERFYYAEYTVDLENDFVAQLLPTRLVNPATVNEAIEKGQVIVGMTKEEMLKAKGQPFTPPSIRVNVVTDTGGPPRAFKIEEYSYPDVSVVLSDGFVYQVVQQRLVDEGTVQEAIKQKMVLVGMTRDEVLKAKGTPVKDPTMRIEPPTDTMSTRARKVEELAYTDGIIKIVNGYVESIMSHMSPEAGRAIENVSVQSVGAGGVLRETRVYRLKYAEPQEVVALVRQFLTPVTGKFISQEFLRIVIVEDERAKIEVIDQIMRLIDTPRYDNGISIMRTPYIDGTTYNRLANDITFSKEIAMVRLGTMVDDQTKQKLVAEVKELGDRLFNDFVALWVPEDAAKWSFNMITIPKAVVMIGPPGVLDVITSFVSTNFVTLSNDDIQRTVENGGLIQGMTRDQVEIALKEKATTAPRQVSAASGILWEYQYPKFILRFKNDQLYQILSPPTEEQLQIAKETKMLYWGLTKAQLDDIVGERGTIVASTSTNAEWMRFKYADGEALFSRNRLEEFAPTSSSKLIVPGTLMPGAGGLGNIYGRLSIEDRQRLVASQIAMPGMSLSDVFAMYAGTQPTFVKAEVDDDGRAVWTYRYPGQTIKVRNNVVTEVNTEGQDERVTKIVRIVSRNAADIVPHIIATFYSDATTSAAGASANTSDTSTENVRIDPSSNSIIIRDKLSRMSSIVKFIEDLDKTTQSQVLVEAKFVEVNRNAVKALGVKWGLSTQARSGNRPFAGFGGTSGVTDATQPGASVLLGPPGSATSGTPPVPYTVQGDAGMLLGMFGGNGFSLGGLRYTNVDFLITALEDAGDAQVLSSPRITTMNNEPANLRSVDTVYDVTVQTTVSGNPPVTQTSTVITPRDVGITLDINPTIGQDGVVTLDLGAEVSRVLRQQQFGNSLVNIISRRNSQSRVMVRSGMPLVIGGLTTRQSNKDVQKVPLLGSLPIVGHLFKTESKDDRDVDLLIFLTARVVPADGSISDIEKLQQAPRPEIPNPKPSIELSGTPTSTTKR